MYVQSKCKLLCTNTGYESSNIEEMRERARERERERETERERARERCLHPSTYFVRCCVCETRFLNTNDYDEQPNSQTLPLLHFLNHQ